VTSKISAIDATLAQVASLLPTGASVNSEQMLKQIILDYVERQIALAEAEIGHYEQEYEWTEWKAALDVLDNWRRVKAAVEQRV
jgi:hypothetical protein